MDQKKQKKSPSGRSSTALYKYEPRLLSRSTTILKPSSKTCCSIVWRTFAGAIGFSASLFGVRFRVEGVSARTGAILIQDRNCDAERGQQVGAIDLNRQGGSGEPPLPFTPCPDAAARAFRRANPARDRNHAYRRCGRCRRNDDLFSCAQTGRNNSQWKEFRRPV